jgi:TonB-dependent starch-binding outer membrane protein SusC
VAKQRKSMLKTAFCEWTAHGRIPHFTKTLILKMKLTALLLMIGFVNVSASVSSQTVTFSGTNVSIKKIFTSVEQQTGYVFLYRNEVIANVKPITIAAKNQPLLEFLQQLFKDQPLSYFIESKTINISPAAKRNINTPQININPPPVSGIVRGPDGQPIANANVIIKGTKKGTNTNADGSFLINASRGEIIIISSIGFNEKQITIEKNNIGIVILVLSETKLDEVQIIAYGTTTKRLSTGNVNSIKANDISKSPVQNPLLSLQGRIPGLFIEQSTGYANTGIKIRIQGQNSIAKGNDPLYVIDGVPYVNQLLPTLDDNTIGSSGNGFSGGNPLSFINPNDIESIDVLKDADATSIYGSRAANGAILITTKKGVPGTTKIEVNLQKGWSQVSRKLDLLNTPQYLEMRKEAKKNDNSPIAKGKFGDVDLLYWSQTDQTDWQKQLIGNTAKSTDARLSFSGGDAINQFLIGGAFHRETTVIPGDFDNIKGSFHINLNSGTANNKFKIRFSGGYLADNNEISTADLTQFAMQLAPNSPSLYTNDGQLNWQVASENNVLFSSFDNPLAYTKMRHSIKTSNLVSSSTISYQLFPGLELKSNFGYTRLQINEVSTNPIDFIATPDLPFAVRGSRFAMNNINSFSIEPQLTFRASISKGKIEALLGSTIYQNDQKGQILNTSGYNSDLVLEDIKSATTIIVDNNQIKKYKYNAVFGRINYNWESRYILNLNLRRDGSSRFGSENRFHNFGSIAGAWVFIKERFFAGLNTKAFSFGKLRISYGTTGNDQINDYGYLNLYQNSYDQGSPYQGIRGLQPIGLQNRYLQWEETKKLQFGLDLGFNNEKILMSANYNHNSSSNQLLNYYLPSFTGFGQIEANFPATIINKGWEFSISSLNISHHNFTWSSSFNLTIPKNILSDFPNLESSSYANSLVIGKSINAIKLFKFGDVNPVTGIYRVVDNKGLLTENPDDILDRTVVYDPDPVYYGGISNNFNYHGITFDFLLQFVKQIGKNYNFGSNVPGRKKINQPISLLDRWQKEGDISSHERYNSNSSLFFANGHANDSDAAWSDASYIRLKNISLSWQLPARWRSKSKLKDGRVYVLAQNLLTISNYQGLDPETKNSIVLPPLRVITFGLQFVL